MCVYINKKIHPFLFENPTLALLKSSLPVALSGVLRVHIACLLLQIHSNIFTCMAGGLIIYSVYTLDRALDSEEDKINHLELKDSKKEIGILAAMLSFIIGAYIFAREGILSLAFFPFVTGFLYSQGIKMGKFVLRLKGSLGVKNIVTGLTWGVSVTGAAGCTCNSLLPMAIVLLFFGSKVGINSVICDFKDLKGDLAAGIKTLPVCLGTRKTRGVLTGLHILSHLIVLCSMLSGYIGFEPVIILYSFTCGLFCIWKYTKTEDDSLERTFFIDGESITIVGLKTIANFI